MTGASQSTPQSAVPSIRTLTADGWEDFYDALEVAFGGEPDPPEERALWRELTDPERALAAWDGPALVGGAAAFGFELTAPGGVAAPTAGVTMVGVLPTHRRRGLLGALMRRQLDDVRARGEALAALTASESGIYGRFGYGLATWRMSVTVPRGRVSIAAPAGPAVRLRLGDPAAAAPDCERVYAELVPRRPGMLRRAPGWERLPLLDPPGARDGHGPLQCVLAEDAATGRVRGYARYRVRTVWSGHDLASGTVEVRDVAAAEPAVHAALWRYLLGLDLAETIAVDNLPTDDPLLRLVSDPRRLEPRVTDALYVRLVAVGAALGARDYGAPLDVVLEVADAFCPWNAGRWRLRAGGPGHGASCARTDDPAELALDVRELGAAYLGGATLAALAGAGLVRELRPGALAAASRAFVSDVAPWLPHEF